MVDLGNFDASQVDPSSDFEPLPEGIYTVMIVSSETKPTKAGTGHYLEMKLAVCNMEKYNGYALWVRLNLDNPSEKAMEIANKELSAICHAVGVLKPGNTDALENIPFDVRVVVEKRKDNDQLANRISSFLPRGAKKDEEKKTGGEDKAAWLKK